jgi:uracil-DNA glycosylase
MVKFSLSFEVMHKTTLPIHQSWNNLLKEEFEAKYYHELIDFVNNERTDYQVFPSEKKTFEAFNKTPFDTVRVIILGQDPYHEIDQANGLCFSVNDGVRFPPSLKNILTELKNDLNIEVPTSGNLAKWATQGVLLLNSTLTVRAHAAGSHQKHGWETLTDVVIQKLSNEKTGLVFLLWGNFAQQKENLISKTNGHLILKAPHPSPFSAHKGFFGCAHFSATNAFLKRIGHKEIDWSLD